MPSSHRPRMDHRREPETDLQLLTPDQVADLLQVTKDWLYDQAQMKKIPAIKLGRMLRFRRRDIESYLDRVASGSES